MTPTPIDLIRRLDDVEHLSPGRWTISGRQPVELRTAGWRRRRHPAIATGELVIDEDPRQSTLSLVVTPLDPELADADLTLDAVLTTATSNGDWRWHGLHRSVRRNRPDRIDSYGQFGSSGGVKMGGVVAAYQRDPDMAPDELFEPGRLDHLVEGNSCRLLDPRRTPLRVLSVRPDIGFFGVEVLAFEDRGARWELPLEWVERLQFPLDGATAEPSDVARLDEARRRFDRRLDLDVDPAARQATMTHLTEERAQASAWLDSSASPWGLSSRHLDPEAPRGDPLLIADLDAYLEQRGLTDLECRFASGYVSNPSSGDLVKAHAIVAAELGLAPYHGPILRDPDARRGDFATDRRASHLLARIGYVSAVFRAAGHEHVVVHRGMSFEHAVDWRPTGTFVSATFSLEIATSQAALGPNRPAGVLMHQRVSVDRLLMTHHETGALNDRFHEAEAVLLADPTALF